MKSIDQSEALPRSDTPTTGSPGHDPYIALHYGDFRLLTIGKSLATLGEQMVNVAIGWQLYEQTGSALVLGGIGLVQVIPVLLLSLPAGHLADRANRRRITLLTQLALAAGMAGLALLSAVHGSLLLIYACLLGIGAARAYNDPASSTLLAEIVPPEAFANAATWSSSAWQLAAVIGPALGGILIAVSQSATIVYVLAAGMTLLCALTIALIRGRPFVPAPATETIAALREGLQVLWHTRVLLAAITLDLFAVLFGGATTLLPIYARDILHVGPSGLGWLRAAPSIGAVLTALLLAYLPPFKRAGTTLLLAVAGFGVATIVFGASRSFGLSLAMLALLGALDSISVVIRSTLLLTESPNQMRGRISAVNSIFIGASNELGGFESGITAALFGPVIAVIGGGIGTMLVVLLVALCLPEIRRLGRLGGQVSDHPV